MGGEYCRFCLMDGLLISPCKCKGSIGYIHPTCLEKSKQYSRTPDICPICLTQYDTRKNITKSNDVDNCIKFCKIV